MKNVKIKDIARELGLSRNTVSKVLNGKYVPERTKKLVLEKASELNYKQMSEETNRKYNFLLISAKPLTNISFFIPILRTIENICFEKGHQLFQYVCSDKTNAKAFLADYIKSLNINGIICIETFSNSFIKMIVEYNIPTIFLDGSTDMYFDDSKFDIVIQENYAPIKKLLKDLHDKGIRSFGFVGDPSHCLSFLERYQSVLMTTSLCHIEHHSNQDFLLPDSSDFYSNSYAMVKEIKKKNKLAEVYVCANDFIARLFANALASLNIKCPDDIKIIGFDNTNDSRSKRPTITTVSVDSVELGTVLVNLLIFRMRNPVVVKTKLTVGTDIVERESTYIK